MFLSQVVAHKPTFDKEKLKLIQLSTWIEQDITCGTITAIKTRSQYDGPLLNDQTFSPDWNQDARRINELVEELSRQIAREHLLSSSGSSSRLSLASLTSCFSGGGSSMSATGGGGSGGDRDRDGGNMRAMPVQVSHETVTAFARNPRLFLQSPLHLALLCVLCFALVGLLVTFSMLLRALSLGLLLVALVAIVLYQAYTHRDTVLQRLEEASREGRHAAAPALEEASRLVSQLGEKASESFQKASESFQAASAAAASGAGAGSGAGSSTTPSSQS